MFLIFSLEMQVVLRKGAANCITIDISYPSENNSSCSISQKGEQLATPCRKRHRDKENDQTSVGVLSVISSESGMETRL